LRYAASLQRWSSRRRLTIVAEAAALLIAGGVHMPEPATLVRIGVLDK
jgi:hypothetical protein